MGFVSCKHTENIQTEECFACFCHDLIWHHFRLLVLCWNQSLYYMPEPIQFCASCLQLQKGSVKFDVFSLFLGTWKSKSVAVSHKQDRTKFLYISSININLKLYKNFCTSFFSPRNAWQHFSSYIHKTTHALLFLSIFLFLCQNSLGVELLAIRTS